jgi:hypothetical protein
MIYEAKRPKTARVQIREAAGGYESVAPETRTAQLALPRFSALGSNRSEELWLRVADFTGDGRSRTSAIGADAQPARAKQGMRQFCRARTRGGPRL